MTSKCTCDRKACLYIKNISSYVAVHPCNLCPRLSCFLRGHAASRRERKQKRVAEIQLSQERFVIKGNLLPSRIGVFWKTWFCSELSSLQDAGWDGWRLEDGSPGKENNKNSAPKAGSISSGQRSHPAQGSFWEMLWERFVNFPWSLGTLTLVLPFKND